jgi:hypothetical protein
LDQIHLRLSCPPFTSVKSATNERLLDKNESGMEALHPDQCIDTDFLDVYFASPSRKNNLE